LAVRRYLFEDVRANPALYARHLRDVELGSNGPMGERKRVGAWLKRLERQGLYLLNRLLYGSGVLAPVAAAGERLFLRDPGMRALLLRINPDILLTTYPINALEAIAMAEAKRLGITTVVQLLSWDNITSKGRFPVVGDYFISWGPIMTQELVEHYGISRDYIFETGVAHFDAQVKLADDNLRANILTALGLDPARPYILFGMSSPIFAPREIDIVEELANCIRRGEFGDIGLVIRPHPQNVRGYMADESWLPRLRALQGTRVGIFWPKLAESDLAWALEESDLPALASVMAGCTINLNSGSTFAIDGLVHRKPVVLTFFDADKKLPWHRSARRCAEYIHLRKLIETGGLFPVWSFAELKETLHKLLANPGLNIEARLRALHLECGPVDGRAAERIAAALATIINMGKKAAC
ncbi:MAG: hypothetical protein N3G20_02465, partial [Verrucomicrobiae bacterium]|nr:hypothetical protein [Verrucomicrobiae bacterium]